MRYTVIWSPEALSKLADLWNKSTDREGISRSADAIERKLRDEPEQQGEDYYGDRLLVEYPLAVGFRVLVEDRIADIFDVWSR
jgi:plasmid stabilization system protein ParE